MTSSSLVELLRLFASNMIQVWLGWGVDALLQTQTRVHKDVDIIVSILDVPKLQELLGMEGFSVQEGEPPNSFVLSNDVGLEDDVHAVSSDDDGNGVCRIQDGEDWIYPAEGFSGHGIVEE